MMAWKGGRRHRNGSPSGLGRDFCKLVVYLLRATRGVPDPNRVAWISYRRLEGVDGPLAAAQVMRAAGEHPRVQCPVYHCGLSLCAGEHLDHERWDQAVDQVLHSLGLARHQALVVAHRDTAREHAHVVVNRIGDDGRAWQPTDDLLKAQPVLRRLEIDFGLSQNPDLALPRLTAGAYVGTRRTGHPPLGDRVGEQAAAFAEAADWRDLEQRLAVHGFRLAPATWHSGLVVTDGSRFVSLSGVDRSLSGPKLAWRFGETFLDHRLKHPEPPAVPPPGPPPGPTPDLQPGATPDPPPGANLERRAAALLDRLTGTCATFTEADLHRAAFHHPDRAPLVHTALRSDQILDLGKDARGATHYTTRDYLAAEARLLASAAALASRADLRLDPTTLPQTANLRPDPATLQQTGDPRLYPATLPQTGNLRLDPATLPQSFDRAAIPNLTAGPRAAVLHATTGADLAQIAGPAGAARAEVARAVATSYRDHGYEVRGAAVAAHAAAALETATGAPSHPLASLERDWSAGAGRLHDRCVLLLDEAGALGVRQLGRVLAHAEERGAKVILLGDPDRLTAIGAGDAFRGLLEQHPSASLAPRAGAAGPPRKDLASDYAAADLRRAVSRLQDLAAQTAQATLEQRPLRQALAALESLRDARLRVVTARRALAAPAAQAYTDPARALRGLLRDPVAPARLRQGKVRAYGKLRGSLGLAALRPRHAAALPVVASLTVRLETYRQTVADLQAAKLAVRALPAPGPGTRDLPAPDPGARYLPAPNPGVHALPAPDPGTRQLPARPPRPAEIRRELARVGAILHRCQQAQRAAQEAIETAVRGMGRATLDSALLLLPPKAAIPVDAAVRAVARGLERALDLGLGR